MSEPQQPFVHLHVHSEYSLLDGLSRIDDLVRRAVALNQPALALTDHGAMYGAMSFYRACTRARVKPILGLETYVAARSMVDRDPQLDKKRFHLLLLAQDMTGYQNLLSLATAAQLDGFYYKPRIDRDLLAQHGAGLIATTGCLAGEIPQALLADRPDQARQLMGEYLDIFGPDRFFVELQEHGIPELVQVNRQLIEMAPHFGLENNLLATNDVHYTRAEDAGPHDVLLCIQTGAVVNAPNRMRFSDQGYYLKSRAEMARLFGDVPGALDNSLRVADMVDVTLDSNGSRLPEFEVPAGQTPASYLRQLCEKGLSWRYGPERAAGDAALRARLEHELGLIQSMGFDTYFLIVWDLCQWANRSDDWWARHHDPYPYDSYDAWKRHDIWFNVRGSGAGSVVAYTLGITCLDPLVNGLIFERFLNPGRVSMPDIDLDFPDDLRHQMVEYARRRYGQEKVAQIITFGTLGARAAIRDVGRAFDMPLNDVDRLARLVPAIPGKPAHIDDVLNAEHDFYNAELAEQYRDNEDVRNLLDTARQLEGVARHASSHAAGVIISDRPLHEYVPLNRPTSGDEGLGGLDRVTQWPMEIVEAIGLLKVDFLGLSTLTIMRQAARLIEERHGIAYTMDNIPYDLGHVGPDPDREPEALFEMLGQGQVAGVFQVEGAGMRRLMMEMKPRRFDHIIAAISLYRPGPMENIPEYIRRMHASINNDENIVEYHTPALEPILKDTYGILVYQEQIIRIAADLAGYAPGEADMIRKAVAKKKQKLMDEHRIKFTKGAMARGFSREVCEAIWGDIEFFARYGFNKAHAADYAKVTCQTAFLKAHYPVEYLAAMLSVERDKTEKIRRYFVEARNLGIEVAPPHINRSALDFTIEQTDHGPTIRFGLGAIKNVGEGAVQAILAEREANGPFKNLQDLCDRVDLRRVGKRALEFLIKGQVFRSWGSVPQFVEALERIVNDSGKSHDAAAAGQMSLFAADQGGPAMKMTARLLRPANEVPVVDHKRLLEWEKEALGVHVSEHPLERPLALLQARTTATIGELDKNFNGKILCLAGMISTLRPYTTRRGDPMAFAALEDLEGKLDLVFFPRIWKQVRDQVAVDQVMLVTGKLQAQEDQMSLVVERIETNFHLSQPATAGLAAPGHEPPSMPEPTAPPAVEENRATGRAPAGEEPAESPRSESLPPEKASTGPRSIGGRGAANGRPPPPPNFEDEPPVGPPPGAAGGAGPESATPGEPPASPRDDRDAVHPGSDFLASEPAGAEGRITAQFEAELMAEVADLIAIFPAAKRGDAQGDPEEGDESSSPAAGATVGAAMRGQSRGARDQGNGIRRADELVRPVQYRRGKQVRVEIDSHADWRRACRDAVQVVVQFNGPDQLAITIPAHNLEMTFPNHPTFYCPELAEALERLPGVRRVFVT